MAYSNFPRFPYVIQDEAIQTVWDLMDRWSSSLVSDIQESDDYLQKRKTDIDENGSIKAEGRIKVEDTASTVTPRTGDIRFNSSTNKFQGYDGTAWRDFH